MTGSKALILALCCVAGTAATCHGQKTAVATTSTDVLRAVRTFGVDIDIDSKTAATAVGRDEIELRLRQAGIAIDTSAMHTMRVSCMVLDDQGQSVVAYTCAVYIRQPVNRVIPAPMLATATVWSTRMMIATVGASRLGDSLRKTTGDLVTEFLNAWYTANPVTPR